MSRILSGLPKHIAMALSPVYYAQTLGLQLFDWQINALCPDWLRLLLLCARQAGKTTHVLGVLLAWKARFYPGGPFPVICPAKHQSRLVMDAVRAVIGMDKDYPELVGDAIFEIETVSGSRIMALPGTERSVRGPSKPKMIVFDEDGRVPDGTYRAARPMMLGADTQLVLSSTAFGKRGHFYETAEDGDPALWHKMLVRSPWDAVNGRLQDHAPEEAFRKHWAKRGWSAWYSDRHAADKAFVQEEADGGLLVYDQEHCCRFLDSTGSLFSTEDLDAAHDEEVVPMLRQMTGLSADEESNYDTSVEVMR